MVARIAEKRDCRSRGSWYRERRSRSLEFGWRKDGGVADPRRLAARSEKPMFGVVE